MRWPSEQTVSELLDLLYESAATPAVWEQFLTRLAQVMEATHAAVILDDFLNRQYSIGFRAGFSNEAQKLYSERVAGDDPFVRRAVSNYPAGWIGIGQSLVRDEDLIKANVYNEYMRFYNIFHVCGSLITYDGSACQCLTVLRPKRAGRFSKTHVNLLSSLIPHVKRALRLHYKITDLRAAAESVQSAIDSVSTAIILFDSTGRVLHANPSAQQILASGEALVIKDGCLRLLHSHPHQQIVTNLTENARTDATAFLTRCSTSSTRSSRIPHPSEEASSLYLCPVCGSRRLS
jgi:PAS domain-containing protein